jgi:hypothetical protein
VLDGTTDEPHQKLKGIIMESTTTTPTNRERAEAVVKDLALAEQINEIERLIGELEHQKKANADLRNSNNEVIRTNIHMHTTLRNHFKDELDGDKNATIEMDLDDINGLLNRLGIEELQFTYSAKVTISFEISGIDADDEDDAERKIQEAVNWSLDLEYGDTSNEDIEVTDVEAE